MSGRYRPDDNALPVSLWETIYLANRDLAGFLPIDFVTHAGVSLTSACFAHGIFDDSKAEKCVSNLLAARFERFIVDLYWHPSQRQFALCPVVITSGSPSLNTISALTTEGQASPSVSDVSLERQDAETTSLFGVSLARPTIMSGARVAHNARQVDASSSTGASGSTSSTSQSPTTVAAPTSAPSSSSGTPLNDTGLYECTSNLNLPFLASLVADYINSTSDTLSANLLFFEFNLHTARPGSAPVEPAPTLLESELPSQTELAGGVFNNFTSPLLYQFSELLTERANLNDSWYSGSASEEPISEYFITADSPGGPLSTPNGWPSEYFVEFKRFKRVLLGWGSVDSQMEGYDFDGDSDFVFPQRYISLSTDVSLDRAGRLESGCLYNAEQLTVAETNSSWAVSVLNTSSSQASGDSLGRLAGNLTSCGITPVLNTTLGNQTADLNALPYIQFVQSTVWNWAPGEPRVIPVQDANSRDDENTQTPFRCALMETSLTRNASRWRAEYCDKRHRTACRIANEPYLWRLSAESVPFSDAEGACEANSSFSVPCTGLENMYLYQHILALPEESRSGLSGDESGVWLNLNSLDVEACWVTTGPNGTCPHSIDEEAIRQRTVLVPVVAALVVLLLTALTMFVKCNKNRWNSRKRIRGEGGWDYEGVPS